MAFGCVPPPTPSPRPPRKGPFGRVLLITMRALQGIAYGCTSSLHVYAVERPPKGRSAVGVMFISQGALCGILCGTLAYGLLNTVLSPPAMMAWGWRLPFLLGGLPGLGSCIAAHGLAETQAFLDLSEVRRRCSPPPPLISGAWVAGDDSRRGGLWDTGRSVHFGTRH